MLQGKIDSKYRYLYTKIDEKAQFLVMKKCNLCPFLINEFDKGEAHCAKHINAKSSFKDKNFISKVSGYRQRRAGSTKMDILSDVDIPFWCNLPNHLAKMSPNDNIYSIKDGKLFIESGQNYANTVQIIDSVFVKYDEKHQALISKPKEEKKAVIRTPYKNTTNWKPKHLTVCSSCGEVKDEIDRDIHIGMCDECWGKNKFSHPKRHHSRINNFRLKRRETWVDEEFKTVKK